MDEGGDNGLFRLLMACLALILAYGFLILGIALLIWEAMKP